jgi:uncharacterized protein
MPTEGTDGRAHDGNPRVRFHLAVPVDDLGAARHFYGEVLGCPQGREADTWVDWDLYGHQVVTHLVAGRGDRVVGRNPVDGHEVPVPHFGALLEVESFHRLAERLFDAGVEFVIAPHRRFAGEAGDQWTMFCFDPAGNALEFKAFADDSDVFRR